MPLHLQKRGGIWHYSRTVPPDVRGVIGVGRYWRFTLGTANVREAEAQRSVLDVKHQEQIDEIRGMTGAQTMQRIRVQHKRKIEKLTNARLRKDVSHEGLTLRPAPLSAVDRDKSILAEPRGSNRDARAAYSKVERDALSRATTLALRLNDQERSEVARAGGVEAFYWNARQMRLQADASASWGVPPTGDKEEIAREAKAKLLSRKEAILAKLELHDRAALGIPETPDNPRLLAALESWLVKRPRKPPTVVKYRLHIRRLADFAGNVTIKTLTPETVAAFVETYGDIPNARAMKPVQRKLNMMELLALRKLNPELSPMGAVNVRKMTDYLRAFLRAIKREDLRAAVEKPEDTRPYEKQREGYPSIPPHQMRLLLPVVDDEFGPNSDTAWWTYLLAYSGLRPEEGAQLARENILKIGNTWAMKIDDLARKIKNKKSLRTVPIHPRLLELGFINFARPSDASTGRVFQSFEYDDKGGRANNPSRRLKRVLTALGINGYGSAHRFRATFIDAMRNAELSYSVELGLVGHSEKNPVHGRYGAGADLRTMARALTRVDPLADPA